MNYEELANEWAKGKTWASGYQNVPKHWTREQLNEAARAGYIKVATGRYASHRDKVTPYQQGAGWRLLSLKEIAENRRKEEEYFRGK